MSIYSWYSLQGLVTRFLVFTTRKCKWSPGIHCQEIFDEFHGLRTAGRVHSDVLVFTSRELVKLCLVFKYV